METIYLLLHLSAFVFLSGLTLGAQAQSEQSPQTIEQLVNSAELIVIGKPTKVLSKGVFYGYQANAETLAQLDKLTPIPLGLPYVDYELRPVQIIMGDKGALDTASKPIVYRVIQSHAPQVTTAELTHHKNADNFLFFLSKNPQGNAYGLKTPMHRLKLNENTSVTYSFKGKYYTPHTLREGYSLSSEQFLDKVLKTVAKKKQQQK